MAKKETARKEKGYKGERPGTVRERVRKAMDEAIKRGMSRAATITLATKGNRCSRSTATNWFSRWHGEHRAS